MHRVAELTGIAALDEATTLLQRARNEHPTQGLWEAADRQWWWRVPRATDDQPQLFWYDEHGPVAAALTTEWSWATWLDLITLPSMKDALIGEVFERGQSLVESPLSVEMLVDDTDEALIRLLSSAGFTQQSGDVTAWMDAGDLPPVTALPDGYSLHSRASYSPGAHHFSKRAGEQVEDRLRQTSLYRPDLDLFVVDGDGEVAAYGLFWNDPVTGVGMVEPMRAEEAHQGRGLARHVLASGIHGLAAAGAERTKVSYVPDNQPAVALYLGAGFEPKMTCSLWTATTETSSR